MKTMPPGARSSLINHCFPPFYACYLLDGPFRITDMPHSLATLVARCCGEDLVCHGASCRKWWMGFRAVAGLADKGVVLSRDDVVLNPWEVLDEVR